MEVEVDVLGFQSLTVRKVSVEGKATLKKKKKKNSIQFNSIQLKKTLIILQGAILLCVVKKKKKKKKPDQVEVQCCFTSTESIIRTVFRDGEPGTATSTFTQIPSSDGSQL